MKTNNTNSKITIHCGTSTHSILQKNFLILAEALTRGKNGWTHEVIHKPKDKKNYHKVI